MKRDHPLSTTRRQVLRGAAGLAAVSAVGCGGSEDSGGAPDTGRGAADLGAPEITGDLWQTMSAYMRASADGSIGSRINLFNVADVAHRVVIQVFTPDGVLVAREVVDEAFAQGRSEHIELSDLLARHDVPLPFEGSVWVGATPASGEVFMGLQGIIFDWYGPSHSASVHGMRDFGNSNADSSWTDLILPKVINTDRYVTRVAVLNASGDGISEALIANPEVIIRDDRGAEIVSTTLPALAPYCSTIFAVTDLPGGEAITTGTLQVREPAAGLVVYAFVFDKENEGFTAADHLFDRHFVVHGVGFTG